MTNKPLNPIAFEVLDAAMNGCIWADAWLMREPQSLEATRALIQAENRLYDVIISLLIGYPAASQIPSLTEWAAERATSFLPKFRYHLAQILENAKDLASEAPPSTGGGDGS